MKLVDWWTKYIEKQGGQKNRVEQEEWRSSKNNGKNERLNGFEWNLYKLCRTLTKFVYKKIFGVWFKSIEPFIFTIVF
jgi:hypothetical protein